jgi:cytochrome oxidase assembly protein ShyY1
VTSPVLAPRAWGVHLLVLLAVAAAGWLGWWQFGAWQAHRDAAQRDLTHATPIPLADALGPDDPLTGEHLGQPVTIEGTWLDNHVAVKRPGGVWEVGFLQTNTGSAIPVVLGWHGGRSLPQPLKPTDTVVGWLQPSQDNASGTLPGGVLPALRIADLAQRVDVDLYGAYVVADHSRSQDAAWGDLRQAHLEQQPSAGSWAGLRNLFYGVEWWFFAGFAIFLWIKWMRDETREQAATEDAVPLSA